MHKGPRYLLMPQENTRALAFLRTAEWRCQLVYLDPPYNTGRLRGARKLFRDACNKDWRKEVREVVQGSADLLGPAGFLAASINQTELFTLKQVLDDALGEKCFVGLFPVKIRHRQRQLMINATFHDLYEYLLIYRKNPQARFITTQTPSRPDKFIHSIHLLGGPDQTMVVRGKNVQVYLPHQYEIAETGYSPDALRRYVIAGKLATANWSGEWYETHLKHLGENLLIQVPGLERDGLGYRWFQTGNGKRRSGVYFQSQLAAGRPLLPTNDLDFTEVVPTIYREGGPGCDFKDSKKPEAILRFLMEICTRPGDSVLDPYAGSGTTLAVAVKMGRSAAVIEKDRGALKTLKTRVRNLKAGRDLDGVKHEFALEHVVPLSPGPGDLARAKQ
ncbi:MAG: site-specific DNA-methyltransferase [Planctomycetes bacterium]|nr:site-specific DNA-methyltransferase [Planctomycetota bacterium]